MNVVVRLLTALLASLIGWIGFTGSAAAGSVLMAPPATYTYDHPGNPGALSLSSTERGPPTTYDRATTHDAVDSWSHGASVRPPLDTSPTAYAYNDPAPPAQATRAPAMAPEQVRDDGGAVSALARSGVAANSGSSTWAKVSAWSGREYKFGSNFRIAPFGNRTGHPTGRYPHYHRRVVDDTGETLPGQGIGRHRPWDEKSTDTSVWDRF